MERKSKEIRLDGGKSHSNLISLMINNQSYKICFDQLAKQSDFFKSQNYSKDTANTFAKIITDTQKKLNILDENLNNFINFLSGDSIIINQINSFDFYKLSSFFEFKQISQEVFLIWQFQVESFEDDIDQYLHVFDNSVKNDKQRKYFNEFIQYTPIFDKLKSNINSFFNRKYIDHFSPYFIYFLLSKCDPKNIPQIELFNFVQKSDNDYHILIQFFDFDYLVKEKNDQFFLFIFGQYSQLLKSNEDYIDYMKLKPDDEKSIQILKEASKNGNCVASHQLSVLIKNESEKYSMIFNAQKQSTEFVSNFYQRILLNKTSNTDKIDLNKNDKNGQNKNDKIDQNKNDKKAQDKNDKIDQNKNDKIDQDKSSKEKIKSSKNTEVKGNEIGQDKNSIEKIKSIKKDRIDQKSHSVDHKSHDINQKDHKIDQKSHSVEKNSSSSIDNDNDNDDFSFEEEDEEEIMNNEEEELIDNNNNDNDDKPTSSTNQKSTSGVHQTKNFGNKRRPFNQIELRNQKIYRETEKICNSGQYTDTKKKLHDVKKQINWSNKNTKMIDRKESYSNFFEGKIKVDKWGPKEINSIYSKIEIQEEGTFESARRIMEKYKIKNVCALNFASATKPGGGVKNGRTAQEETISRQSSLYFSLITQERMYNYFKKHKSPFYNHTMIYSPKVVVFRNEKYELVPPIFVSVITSPAVNYALLSKRYKKGERDKDVYDCMKNRCRKILELAIVNDNKGIILGAFGCGVFKNKPELISKIFKELLIDEFYGMFFDKIVFAIKSNPNKENINFFVFKETFKKK